MNKQFAPTPMFPQCWGSQSLHPKVSHVDSTTDWLTYLWDKKKKLPENLNFIVQI
jgi:hypothetical protein